MSCSMDKLKYIANRYDIVIFSYAFTHAEMAAKVGWLREGTSDTVTSAGFFSCGPDSISCFGESTTLGLKSNPEDAERIARKIRGY